MKRLILLCCWLLVQSAIAQERILDFQSTIVVNKDRSVDVTEIIKVKAEEQNIEHGIFRDIITMVINERGRKQALKIAVTEVLRNGVPEPFITEPNNNVTRIRIGSADVFLEDGEYTYTVKYNLERQVRFFETYDEVYWNATGNDWQFAIDKASITISLPEGAVISQHAGYSGPSGATGCDCKSNKTDDRSIQYAMSRGLNQYEGLTVGVGWQKGIIEPPTQTEIDQDVFEDNKGIYYGVIGLLMLGFYLMIAWFIAGRDPSEGAVIPRFNPPDGYSPAACRYVMQMGYDNKAFTASIISIAVKGYLVIDKTAKKYVLRKSDKHTGKLTNEEEKIYSSLFSGKSSITLGGEYESSLSGAIEKLKESLKDDFKKLNFKKNSGWMAPAIFMGIAICGVVLWTLRYNGDLLGITIVGSIILLILFGSFISGIKKFNNSHGYRKVFSVISMSFVLGFFVIVPAYFVWPYKNLLWDVAESVAPYLIIVISVVLLISLFFQLIQAPTVLGRKRMDEIEGLIMFMDVAERDRLNMLNPPEKTPQLFERLLPFAMALGVENSWGKQFESIIAQAIQRNEYKPTWYVGDPRTMMDTHSITSNLGSSLSSAVSTSSTPPSESGSSGSGGGGSSGGGGGGGGGW